MYRFIQENLENEGRVKGKRLSTGKEVSCPSPNASKEASTILLFFAFYSVPGA